MVTTSDKHPPQSSTISGMLLGGATLAALAVANSPLGPGYAAVLHTSFAGLVYDPLDQ